MTLKLLFTPVVFGYLLQNQRSLLVLLWLGSCR